ncbi:MAG: Nif3-like dinuclear metal center hexameric protein [Opitutales bacterium]|nr:Nif3-like dinuclear metal center hexameric protein [Opitutales bacterium]MCH8539661.1 Nif3-like dinuclear metal center hexameric protein [Opitutales bacterium]
MASLTEVVCYCNERLGLPGFPDFPGSENGLQVENAGTVTKVGAAVDAGEEPIAKAIEDGVDFLIVHHGLFWEPLAPLTGPAYRKIKTLIESGCAIYSAHLPLDAHPKIGNNALLGKLLELEKEGTFLPYEGENIAWRGKGITERRDLLAKLKKLFPGGVTTIEKGPEKLSSIAILTGSGTSVVPHLPQEGIDTLVTGELKQNVYTFAQEHGLNLYCCGHYATETLGVTALQKEISKKFDLPGTFISTDCPL